MNDVVTKDSTEVQVLTTPDTLLERAVDAGAGPETISQFLELKAQYEAQEAKKAFSEAMAAFQVDKPILPRTKSVRFGSNQQAAYKFCPLDVMAQLLKGPLQTHGLSYSWQGVAKEGQEGQRCIIKHIQGHSEYTELFAPADTSGNKNSIQAIGSTATYLQRYTLKAALGLVEVDEDDDGVTSGDMPYIKLIDHNYFVWAHLPRLLDIRAMLAADDFEKAVEALYGWLTKEQFTTLWIAPDKGGFFTTEERRKITSDQFVAIRTDYFAKLEGDENDHPASSV